MQIIVFNYPTEYIVSNTVRPKYYHYIKDLPKKLLDKLDIDYEFREYKNKKGVILYDKATNEPVIKNLKLAGKPRYKKINGQTYINGGYYISDKKKIRECIKEALDKCTVEPSTLTFPLKIKMDFYSHTAQDIDNHTFVYRKYIIDWLKGKFIPNDTVEYVNGVEENLFIIPYEEQTRINIELISRGN